MKSENEKKTFRARLEELIGDEKPFVWAARIGLTPGVFNRMWNEGTPPKADSLILIEAATGVSLTWFLTGKGPRLGLSEKQRVDNGGEINDGKEGYLDVEPDNLDEITRLIELKMGARRKEIPADKLMVLIKTAYRFYCKDFIGSEKFRKETMEKNIESLVKLALPED